MLHGVPFIYKFINFSNCVLFHFAELPSRLSYMDIYKPSWHENTIIKIKSWLEGIDNYYQFSLRLWVIKLLNYLFIYSIMLVHEMFISVIPQFKIYISENIKLRYSVRV